MQTNYDEQFEHPVNAERIMLVPPFNVVMAAQLSGPLDADAVRSAVARLRQRHALLAVRVQFSTDQTARYCTDGVPELTVREVQVEDHADRLRDGWQREAMNECRTPFHLETGPLVRFAVVRSEGTTHLLATGHHAICDGKSLTFLLRDVLQALSEPAAQPERLPPPPPIDETTVPTPPRTPWIARVILKRLSDKWNRKGLSFDESHRQRLQETFWKEQRGATALAWSLGRDKTSGLVAACRAEGVTVNSAIWTAFLLAQKELQGDSPAYRRQCGMAVSTRDRLNRPVGEALGFYASSLSLKLAVDSNAAFWDAARQVQARIRKALDKTDPFRMLMASALPPTLLDSLYLAKYKLLDDPMASRMLKRMNWDRTAYGYSITNVGRSDMPTRYGPLTVEAVYGPFFWSSSFWHNQCTGSPTECNGQGGRVMRWIEIIHLRATRVPELDELLNGMVQSLEQDGVDFEAYRRTGIDTDFSIHFKHQTAGGSTPDPTLGDRLAAILGEYGLVSRSSWTEFSSVD